MKLLNLSCLELIIALNFLSLEILRYIVLPSRFPFADLALCYALSIKRVSSEMITLKDMTMSGKGNILVGIFS